MLLTTRTPTLFSRTRPTLGLSYPSRQSPSARARRSDSLLKQSPAARLALRPPTRASFTLSAHRSHPACRRRRRLAPPPSVAFCPRGTLDWATLSSADRSFAALRHQTNHSSAADKAANLFRAYSHHDAPVHASDDSLGGIIQHTAHHTR